LQALWDCISVPHLLQATRLGMDICQLCARRLSRRAFEDLPFGQIDICYTSLTLSAHQNTVFVSSSGGADDPTAANAITLPAYKL